jgi:hypothetical protein
MREFRPYQPQKQKKKKKKIVIELITFIIGS